MLAGLLVAVASATLPTIADAQEEPTPAPPRDLAWEEAGSGTFRITWDSVPGEKYLLQRSIDFEEWADVATVVADSVETSAVDDGVLGAPRTFWRVLVADGDDTTAPSVSIIAVRAVEEGGEPRLELTVSATDNVGVVSVAYTEDGAVLGAATAGPDATWVRLVPFDPLSMEVRAFQARASDAAGNAGFSPVYLFDPALADAPIFPLAAGGSVDYGGIVGTLPDGTLNPFIYDPGRAGGDGSGVVYFFPAGARLVEIDGVTYFEYEEIAVRFPEGSPFSFAPEPGDGSSAPAPATAGDPAALESGPLLPDDVLHRVFGAPRLVPLEISTVEELARALGRDPADGLPLLVFGVFPIDWIEGVLTDVGIRGGCFRLAAEAFGLPLPEESARFLDWVLPLADASSISIPFSGSFPVPLAEGASAQVTVPAATPLMLTLGADGRIALEGAVEVALSNGLTFRASAELDDPLYRLTLGFSAEEEALGDLLAAEFPADVSGLVPAAPAPTGAELDAAIERLECLSGAVVGWNALAAAEAGFRDPLGLVLSSIPGDWPIGGQLAPDALAGLAEAGLGGAIPPGWLEAGSFVTERLRTAGLASGDPLANLEALRTATRLAELVASGGLPGGASGGSALGGAVDQSLASARRALFEASGAVTLPAVEAMGIALEGLQAALGGGAPDPELVGLWRVLVDGVVAAELEQLGVVSGQLDASGNDELPDGRPELMERLARLVRIHGSAHALGVAGSISAPLGEGISQLGGAAWGAADQAWDLARAGRRPDEALAALSDLRRLLAWRDVVEARGLATNWDAIFVPDDEFPDRLDDWFVLLGESGGLPAGSSLPARAERWIRIADLLSFAGGHAPADPGGWAGLLATADADFGAATAVSALDEVGNAPDLVVLVRGGAALGRAARLLGLPTGESWSGARIPRVVARARELAVAALDAAVLVPLLETLVAEARRARGEAEATVARALLESAASLVGGASTVAADLWQAGAPARAAGERLEGLELVEGFLIRRAAGSIAFNRRTGVLEGSVQGRLSMPGFGAELTVLNASVRSTGEFDFNAFGSLELPAGDPFVTLTIPAARPLHLRWDRTDGFLLDAAGEAVFENGMTFKGALRFEPPEYEISLEAGDVEFDLVREIAQSIPDLPAEVNFVQDDTWDLERLELWSDYYNGLLFGMNSSRLGGDNEAGLIGDDAFFTGNGGESAASIGGAFAALAALQEAYTTGGAQGAAPFVTGPMVSEALDLFTGSLLENADEVAAFLAEPAAPATAGDPAAATGDDPDGPLPEQRTAWSGGLPPRLGLNLDFGPLREPSIVDPPGGVEFDPARATDGPAVAFQARFPEGAWIVEPRSTWEWIQGDTTREFLLRLGATPEEDETVNLTVDFGRSVGRGGSAIDWSREPGPDISLDFFAGSDLGSGVMMSYPMEDHVAGRSKPVNGAAGTETDALGVRVRGLGPGYYYAFVLMGNRATASEDFDLWVGSGDGNFSDAVLTMQPRFLVGSNPPAWTPGASHARIGVTLEAAGDDLVAVARSTSNRPGRISGLQVVAPEPQSLVVPSFRQTFSGEPLRYQFRAWHATRLAVVQDGQVLAEMPFVSAPHVAWDVEIVPLGTGTLEFVCENANQTVTQPVPVTVSVRQQQIADLTKTIGKGQKKRGDLGEWLEKNCSRDDLTEEEADRCAQKVTDIAIPLLEDEGRALIKVIDEIRGDPESLRDDDLVEDIIRTALENGGEGMALGAENAGEVVQKVAELADARFENREKDRGLDIPVDENGEPTGEPPTFDTAKIEAHTLEESCDYLRIVLDESAETAVLGGTATHNDELIARHADNALEKMIALVTGPGGEITVPDDRVAIGRILDCFTLAWTYHALADFEGKEDVQGLGLRFIQLRDRLVLSLLRDLRTNVRTPANWADRLVILRGIARIDQRFGTATYAPNPLFPVGLAEYGAAIFEDLAADAGSQGKILKKDNPELWRALMDLVNEPGQTPRSLIPQSVGDRAPRLLKALEAHDRFVDPGREWTASDLRMAPLFLRELRRISEIARNHGIAEGALGREALGERAVALSERVAAASQALGNTHFIALFNQAIFRIRREIELEQLDTGGEPAAPVVLGEGVAAASHGGAERDPFLDVLGEASFPVLAAMGPLVEAEGGFLDGFDPFEFLLPGNGRIKRVFGRLFYNAETGFLEGAFGGRVELDDYDFFLDIQEASIANDGSFGIAMSTGGQVPVGGGGRLRLDAPLVQAQGSPDGLFTFDGAGTAKYSDADLPGGGPEFGVAVAYRSDTGALSIDSTVGNLAFPFAEDVAVLEASVGIDLSSIRPEGALTIAGKLGVLGRGDALPTDRPLEATDFWLVLDVDPTTFAFTAEDFSATFTGGSLTLPADIFSELEVGDPATVSLGGELCLLYDFSEAAVLFCSDTGDPFTLAFENIAFGIPGLPDFVVAVDEATLELFLDQFPVLRNLDASLFVPLPGPDATDPSGDRTEVVTVNAVDWMIDGLPREASVALATNLRILDFDAFDLDLLGGAGELPECQTRLAFTSAEDGAGGLETAFTLTGGLAGAFDPDALADDETGAAFGFTTCGTFAWNLVDPPTFSLDVVEFGGRFRLGGPNGITVTGIEEGELATIGLVGLENVFMQTPETPFRIVLDGALDIADFVKFGLVDTAFVWEGNGLLPRFEPGGIQGELGDASIDLAEGFIPVYLTEAGLRFRNPALPLLPAAGETGLLDPTNVIVNVSGVANLPAGGAAAGGSSPGISGQVEDLTVGLVRQGDLFVPEISLDGLGLQLENLDIPPLGGITGGIFVGNLGALSQVPPRPQEIYFAGQVGGKVKEIGASILLAARPVEFIGACFELNAGPAGIPLDGGSLGGILLTGGRGGLNFKNAFADPCDFRSYIDAGMSVPPEGSAERPGSPPDVEEIDYPQVPDPAQGFSCIQGPFPPPTVNPLCEPHPDSATFPDRVVFKGTILSEAELNQLGITPAAVPGSVAEGIEWATAILGTQVRGVADAALLVVPPDIPANVRDYYASIIEELVNSFDDACRQSLRQAYTFVSGQDPDVSFYEILVQMGAAGIPCFDVTLKLEGTFSHTAISSVLTGTGGVTLSSTGTAVLEGRINLIGIPVATGTLAFSLTDSQGDINPAFGGVAKVALGPLEFGDMSMAMGCDGCFLAVVDAFTVFLATNVDQLNADALELLYAMMDRAIPLAEGARSRAVDLTAHWIELSDQQKLAYVSSLLNLFQIQANGDPLPVPVGPDTLATFMGSFRGFLVDVLTAVNPTICFSGKVGPRLFGFPLTGGADAIVGAGMLYSRTTDPTTLEEFQELVASLTFSPTTAALFPLMGTYAAAVPAVDQASMGYSLRVPAFTEETVELALTNPPQYIQDQFTTLVEDAVLSFGYQVKPLGLTLGNGQGRMILPRIESHPERPGVAWSLPSGAGVPTRTELILAALTKGQMQNPIWRGQAGELDDLFTLPPNTDPETGYEPTDPSCAALAAEVAARLASEDPGLETLAGLDFARDYFPHGGLIFGGELSFPNVLAQLPPPQLFELLAVPTDLEAAGEWLGDAQFVFENYLAATTCVGQMAGYLPAPNPVFPPEVDWTNASILDLVNGIQDLDVEAMIDRSLPSSVYPFEQILFAGWLDAPILGTPVARGSMEYDPARQCFRMTTEVPAGTWLHEFVQGEIEFQFKAPEFLAGATADNVPVGGPEDRFAEKLAELDKLEASEVLADAQVIVEETVALMREAMPKVSLEASAAVTVPEDLEPFFDVSASSGLEVFAFSPFFEPGFMPEDTSPYAVARRRGGIGLRGDFRLGYFPEGGPDLIVDVPDASFSITPDAQVGLFPALAGQLEVGTLSLPGLPELTGGVLAFNSSPDDLAAYLAIAGQVTPFKFTLPAIGGGTVDLLSFQAFDPKAGVGGTLRVVRDDSIPGTGTGTSLEIAPMAASMPFLGSDVAITVYGSEPSPGEFTPFTFSTTAGEPWEARVCLTSATDPRRPPTFAICDPFDPTGSPCALTFTPSQRVCGILRGEGLQTFELLLEIPQDFSARFFPGQETETTVDLDGAGMFTLYVDSGGRFYVDLGTATDIGLPGALTAGGRIEFGFSPNGAVADVVVTPDPLAFGGTDILGTSARPVTVRNDGSAEANVVVRVEPAEHFTLNEDGFALGVGDPQDTRTFDVIFHPQQTGPITGTLTVESNDPARPVIAVPITGTGTASPEYFQSRDAIAFGETVVGGTAAGSLTLGNAGSAPLTILSVTRTGSSAFAVSPTGGTTLEPGESMLYTVEFSPTDTGSYTGGITIQTAGEGIHTVTLGGTGADSRWLTLLDSDTTGSVATLEDVLMVDRARGWAVGDQGTFLETRNGGRSWIPRRVTTADLNGIHLTPGFDNTVRARYHFEEPPGALQFEDSGPNRFHGSTASLSTAPRVAFDFGRFGNGLSFDGSNDYVDLAAFDLPVDFAISLWVDPADTGSGQAFVAKNSGSGGNEFIFGFYGGQYQVNFRSQSARWGTPQTGWQHLLVQADYDEKADATTVTVHRDGVALGPAHVFTGSIGTFGGGKPWTLGQEWDSTARSDFFEGSIDEVQFLDGVLTSAEIARLAGGETGERLVVSGENGVAFESESMGRVWHQPFDLNTTGFRAKFARFYDYDWRNATHLDTGMILLGGGKDGGRVVLEEDRDPGASQFPDDDTYDEMPFDSSAGTGSGEIMTDLVNVGGPVYGASSLGRLYRWTGTSWFRHGSLDIAGSIFDLEPTTSLDYVGVGSGGAIVRSNNGANPTVVNHGLTTADLHAIAYTTGSGATAPELHAVGDGGVYLTSDDIGTNWIRQADGLEGDNRGIDVWRTGSRYEAWVVGDDHRIQFRPLTRSAAPFLTFFPGALDFGFLTLGTSRTLAVEVANRGSRTLVVDSVDVSGAGFSIVQGDIDEMAPGDSMTLLVRFRPSAATSVALGTLTVATNDGTYSVPLTGRADDLSWEPWAFDTSGEVIEVNFPTDDDGYALVDRTLNTYLYRTTDGGTTWTASPVSWGNHGGAVRIHDIDFADQSNPSVGYACGAVEDGRLRFIRPLLLYTNNGGDTWVDRTPPTSQPITGVSTHPRFPKYCVVVTTGPSGNGEHWQSNDFGRGWDGPATTSLLDFDGDAVAICPNATSYGTPDAQESYSTVVIANGTALHFRSLNIFGTGGTPATSISGGPGVPGWLKFSETQRIRGMEFQRDDTINWAISHGWVVGDRGLFRRSFPKTGELWVPAPDAEVFGTTDLADVSFAFDHETGWIVGESKVFDSRDSGSSWDLNADFGPAADLRTVFCRGPGRAWTGGTLDGRPVVWRFRKPAAITAPVLAANDVELLGTTSPGGRLSRTLTVSNLGDAPLDLQQFSIVSDDPVPRFRIARGATGTVDPRRSRSITVEFEAVPEAIDLAALDPEVFLRFENGFDATTFTDHTANGRVATVPADVARRPRVFQDRRAGDRDRCLRFDGNDYAEMTGIDSLPGDFTISLWVNPDTAGNQQAFFGKHTSGGGNLVLGGIYFNAYSFRIRGAEFHAGTPRPGWQHIVVTGEVDGGSTLVTFWLDGEVLWQESFAAVAGNVAGKPWVLGAEWDGSTSIGDYLRGCVDDFAIFQRVLEPGEIQSLANKSPVCGEHRATLVINSNSEDGERSVDLRARVEETSRVVIVDTRPSGLEVIVDGLSYTSPAAFAVRCDATNPREWAEGSLHAIEVNPRDGIRDPGGTVLTYDFPGWTGRGDAEVVVAADDSLVDPVARYVLDEAVPPRAPAPVLAGDEPPPAPLDAGLPGFDIGVALAGAPQGPFLRFTDGNLSVAQAAAGGGFAIDGELFVGLTRMSGTLETSSVALPATGASKFFELGASSWLLDFEAGERFLLKANPASLAMLGFDVVPDGQFCLELDSDAQTYRALLELNTPFTPLPGLFQIKPGEVELAYHGGTSFTFRGKGGMRVLDLPPGGGLPDWALDTSLDFVVASPDFAVSLDALLGASAPANLFDSNVFEVDWGDVTVTRSPAWGLAVETSTLRVFNNVVAAVSGSAAADGSLDLQGTLASSGSIRLAGDNRFSLKPASGSSAAFTLKLRTGLNPSLKLDVPTLRLHSTVAGIPDGELTIPGFAFDSGGAFDTGKIALPTWEFDGIELSKPSGGQLKDNYLRLERETNGDLTFKARAEIPFLPGCPLHRFKLTVENGSVDASMRGRFCVLPDPISLSYSSGSTCQFQGSGDGFTVFFGSGCAGYRNDATGVCIGICP